ncbi:hypothetical protein FACS1894217_10510 [Clostridia bacterium]|nr:hypothetical protein FACS1894217_10510 [Clostridia bacterium]
MRLSLKTKVFPLIALALIIGAIFCAGTTAYAAEIPESGDSLIVKEVWLTGDTLHINVSDSDDTAQTLELNLRDYAKPADEYVTVQATDSAGRTSNSIQFKNPYYVSSANDDTASPTVEMPSESGISESGKPFTPDGTGTVVDNATNADGKEFFTVETPDGNVFYLIVDRQRNSDNVYLLNTVNEDDLASLAKSGNGKGVSAIETPPTVTPTAPIATPEPTPTPAPVKSGGNTGTIVFVVIAVLVFGGAAYYFKIVRPKKNGADTADDDYDEPENDFDDDTETDLEEDGEDGDDE